jgi:glutathione synthase/RimK-type ligase-like ATP-grasp enzyme
VNPLDAWVLGDSKPFQLQCAARAGLATPPTLVSNEAAAIEAFAKAHPDGLAVKRVSHPVPRVGESEPPAWVLYTHRVRPDELTGEALREAHVAPIGLQAYVEKRTEVRAYVVGERVLSCEILSQDEEGTKVDWRRYPRRADGEIDTERWRCRPYALPDDVAGKLRAAARAMGLRYAAVDLIVTPSGEHVFLEANVMGAFGFAEELAGLPISEAFADLVAAAGTR